ncbi:MAG: hypothetical protein FWG66_06145 [Spirochaetes bacterium]|nr:hypothetical protein [Spirochaetota bacterium]
MKNDNTDFVARPNELDFLMRAAQMKNEAERIKATEEYRAQCKAYWDWVETVTPKNKAQKEPVLQA